MTSKLTPGLPVVYDEQSAGALAKARFGRDYLTLKADARDRLIMLVQQGFNPYTDLMILFDEPYVTIDGWWNAIRRAGRPIARIPWRPILDEERKAYGLKSDELGYLAEVWLVGDAHPYAIGFGKASALHPHNNNPIEKANPARQGIKRASAHALRQTLQGLGFAPQGVGTADAEGVVIEGTVISVTDVTPETQEAPDTEDTETTEGDDKDWDYLRAIEVSNLGDLFTNVLSHFKLTQRQALGYLNVSDKAQIADAQEAWLKIVNTLAQQGR